MKKEELKQLIKPLIKECLKEVLIEEGFTKMLSESVTAPIASTIKPNIPIVQEKKSSQQLQEAKKKMLDAIGNTGFDAFAGTSPLNEGGIPDSAAASVTTFNASDPGVDISKLLTGKLKATNYALNGKKAK